MAFTTEQRTALADAIARGVRKVKMGDEEVEYRSLDEMRRTLRVIDDELAGANTSSVSISYPTTSRGL